MRRILGITISLLVSAASVFAADEYVIAQVWAELDPIIADGTERPLPTRIATERLLADAQFVVSGMVYGYRFEYVPGDPARGVTEDFALEPHATIPSGDPELTVLQTWVDADLLVARVIYELSTEQARWYNSWHGGGNARSSGVGNSSLFAGPESKPEAISDAIRSAIREQARSQVFTRPQKITGAVLLADYPQVSVVRGSYQARVDILLQIDSIERFHAF